MAKRLRNIRKATKKKRAAAHFPPGTGLAISFCSRTPPYERRSYIPSPQMGTPGLRRPLVCSETPRHTSLRMRRPCPERNDLRSPTPKTHTHPLQLQKSWGARGFLLETKRTLHFRPAKLGCWRGGRKEPVGAGEVSLLRQRVPHPAQTPGSARRLLLPQTRPIPRRQGSPHLPRQGGGGPTRAHSWRGQAWLGVAPPPEPHPPHRTKVTPFMLQPTVKVWGGNKGIGVEGKEERRCSLDAGSATRRLLQVPPAAATPTPSPAVSNPLAAPHFLGA